MNPVIPIVDAYREQLAQWALTLTGAEGPSSLPVQLFAEALFAKRLDKLRAQLDFLTEAFADLDALLVSYVRAVPLPAYATAASDAERFLGWLEVTAALSPGQRDHVACQRGRHAVEAAAAANRWGHLRFQELGSTAGVLGAELETNPKVRIHLNPIRARARFFTAVLVGEESPLPVDVVFFAVGAEVRSVLPGPEGMALLRELASVQPCTLAEWRAVSGLAGPEKLAACCRQLAALGLVAFS